MEKVHRFRRLARLIANNTEPTPLELEFLRNYKEIQRLLNDLLNRNLVYTKISKASTFEANSD